MTVRTRAVVLCSPSNPTGAVVDEGELRTILGELRSRGVLVFSDETYQHFGNSTSSAASIELWRDHVVVVGTFSKSFGMTGWRVGYMIADAGICEQALKIQDAMIICAPTISQIAAEAAIREDWNYARRFDADLADRREALIEGISRIPRLRWTRTSGGFFAFVRVESCGDSITLASDVLEHAHVVTIPGATFGRAGEGFLRLSYGAASVEHLQEAFRRLREYFG